MLSLHHRILRVRRHLPTAQAMIILYMHSILPAISVGFHSLRLLHLQTGMEQRLWKRTTIRLRGLSFVLAILLRFTVNFLLSLTALLLTHSWIALSICWCYVRYIIEAALRVFTTC